MTRSLARFRSPTPCAQASLGSHSWATQGLLLSTPSGRCRSIPSRAKTDIPWMIAITMPATAATLMSAGRIPVSTSRVIRARNRAVMPSRMSAIARCTSADADEPLAVALASRQPFGVASLVNAVTAEISMARAPSQDVPA